MTGSASLLLRRIADMPGNTTDLLFRLLRQNGGRLSMRRREREFARTRRMRRWYPPKGPTWRFFGRNGMQSDRGPFEAKLSPEAA